MVDTNVMRGHAVSTETGAVIVTGAAGGIGAAIVRLCAQAGWEVIAADLRAPELGMADQPTDDWRARVHPLAVDLASSSGAQRVVETATAEGRVLTGLVNCAGIMRRGTLLEITEDDWDACFSVNVTAAFRLCRVAIRAMSAGDGGSIVNIASQWGLHPAAGHVAYNASKAAMVSLTQSIARDHGADGIRANAVCPGEVLTPMVEQKLRDSGSSETDLARSVPVGRLGRPDDIAELVVYLLSDRAGYMSGSAVEITGGQVVA